MHMSGEVISVLSLEGRYCNCHDKAGGNNCSLCLEEKLQILRSYNSTSVLNKRSELFTKCVHARRFRAGRFKRTCVSKYIASSIT